MDIPRLIDYNLIKKELKLGVKSSEINNYKKISIKEPSIKPIQDSESIFTFNFILNIMGLLIIFIGIYILNYRKNNKDRIKEESDKNINDLFKQVHGIV